MKETWTGASGRNSNYEYNGYYTQIHTHTHTVLITKVTPGPTRRYEAYA